MPKVKLTDYLAAKAKIERRKRDLEEVKSLCEHAPITLDETKVQSQPKKDKIEALIIRKEKLEEDILCDIQEALQILPQVEKLLDLIEDPDIQLIMYSKYIEGLSPRTIAVTNYCSEATMYRKLDKGLSIINRYREKESKNEGEEKACQR